jgi:hypothetical protein
MALREFRSQHSRPGCLPQLSGFLTLQQLTSVAYCGFLLETEIAALFLEALESCLKRNQAGIDFYVIGQTLAISK